MSTNHSQSDFVDRHVGPRNADIEAMLSALGYSSLRELCDAAIPRSIRADHELQLPPALDEVQAISRIRELADLNQPLKSLIGMGYHGTCTPAVVVRRILESPAWYTAYTPYQPEISQGRLEALLNYQTMVCDLTGMEIANSSLLDESTAAAEAMTMARRLSKSKGAGFFLDIDCHPQTIDVVATRAQALGVEVQIGNPSEDLNPENCYAVLLQYPGSSGEIGDIEEIAANIHSYDGLVCVSADLLSLCLLTPPGELGADLVVGTSQRFGVPLGFGGPHAGYLAALESHKRSMPGRLVGVSVDSSGRPATRLALQTREQHIRREKATSNICTAQVLLAVIASMYAVWHGPDGLKKIAQRVHDLTSVLAEGLRRSGLEVLNDTFFDTLTVSVPDIADQVLERALAEGINLRPIDSNTVGVSLDETCDSEVVESLLQAFNCTNQTPDIAESPSGIPLKVQRTSDFLTHPVFNSYRSETEMLRYIRRLADKDVALDRGMIPLGSCTMKLNATSEMEPITWPEFSDIHPFAPLDQAKGYLTLIAELEEWLLACTGYDAISLQPNAGSQGEFAGLLAIRRYHDANDEQGRDVCLIPSSAHGTNAASAVMAGLRVVVIDCDESGDVDLADLEQKLGANREHIAAIMVTYPSTHGVFEDSIGKICELVHDAGGQVYVDGANLNALVGLAPPGKFGADISHLNLHKTFCIPHGGGGPGVGPIGVGKDLMPHLPADPLTYKSSSEDVGPVSATNFGSASILPISWMYIQMKGAAGLRKATQVAILSANYIAYKLSSHFEILYTGKNGLIAHECIIDVRPLKELCGVEVDDIAKRLIDFGFHAPTMSFPVPGTLMIEPTESESLAELDRFIEAMICIRNEIAQVEDGTYSIEESPLRNAPHSAETLASDDWQYKYSRSIAAYPVDPKGRNKYWPPIGRVDNVYGDKNLMCSCPSMSDYKEES